MQNCIKLNNFQFFIKYIKNNINKKNFKIKFFTQNIFNLLLLNIILNSFRKTRFYLNSAKRFLTFNINLKKDNIVEKIVVKINKLKK